MAAIWPPGVTWMRLGLASSALGTRMRSTPSSIEASTASASTWAGRVIDPTEPVTADAELGLELLVGHLGGLAAQDHQDLDGGWSELGHEPVGEAAVIPPGAGPHAWGSTVAV
jgi:hypothetical protein